MKIDIATVLHYCSPTEAAAIAVIAANVRNNMRDTRPPEIGGRENTMEEWEAVDTFLGQVEMDAITAITKNDGNAVLHIGNAAKQLNPLLS